MSVGTALAIYFLIWWVVLFAVLPFGVRPQGEGRLPGTDPGAPALPRLGRKLLWTTLVSAVVFGIFYYVYTSGILTLEGISSIYKFPR